MFIMPKSLHCDCPNINPYTVIALILLPTLWLLTSESIQTSSRPEGVDLYGGGRDCSHVQSGPTLDTHKGLVVE